MLGSRLAVIDMQMPLPAMANAQRVWSTVVGVVVWPSHPEPGFTAGWLCERGWWCLLAPPAGVAACVPVVGDMHLALQLLVQSRVMGPCTVRC